MKTNVQKEIIAMITLLLVNTVMILFLLLFIFLFEFIPTVKNWKIYLTAYVFFLIITYILEGKIKNKIISFLYLILAFPFVIFFAFYTIAFPFLILQVHLFLYLGLCFLIPTLLYRLYEFLGFSPITIQLQVYLILSFTVICSIIFYKQIRYIVHAFSPARFKNSEKLKPYNIEELSNYLLSENNIKFVVFIIYFILIVIVNFYNFQDLSYYKTEKIDKAVIQSFVTYIAFDRIISSLKQVEFKPSEMVKKLRLSIINKYNKLDKP